MLVKGKQTCHTGGGGIKNHGRGIKNKGECEKCLALSWGGGGEWNDALLWEVGMIN